MIGDFSEIIGIIVVILFVASLVADIVFASTWNKTYFTSGLTIFVKRIPINHWHTNIPHKSLFEKKFHSNMVSSLTFKEIDIFSYGFREKIFQFKLIRYTSVMHGLLIFDTDNGQVIVKGFANWSVIIFSLVWLGLPVASMVRILLEKSTSPGISAFVLLLLGAIAFFILLMASLYLIQYSRFSKVAFVASQLWTRKYVRDGNEA
jgi:hypothetical protein